jgi:hypothetical protein
MMEGIGLFRFVTGKFLITFPLLVGVQGVRLLREKRVKGDPTGASAPRRLPRPPWISEPLERKSTGAFTETLVKNNYLYETAME